MQCPKCGCERQPTDIECSKCGLIYRKWEAYAVKKKAEEKSIRQIEIHKTKKEEVRRRQIKDFIRKITNFVVHPKIKFQKRVPDSQVVGTPDKRFNNFLIIPVCGFSVLLVACIIFFLIYYHKAEEQHRESETLIELIKDKEAKVQQKSLEAEREQARLEEERKSLQEERKSLQEEQAKLEAERRNFEIERVEKDRFENQSLQKERERLEAARERLEAERERLEAKHAKLEAERRDLEIERVEKDRFGNQNLQKARET